MSARGLAATSGDLRAECIESVVPERPEPGEPRVDLGHRTCVEGIEAAWAVGSYVGEAALAQHPQLHRDGRLPDAELRRDRLGDLPGRAFAVGEQLEDAA